MGARPRMPIGVPSNQFDVGKKALPSRLMLTAVDAGTTEVVAILSVVQSTDARICMLNGDGNRCSMYDVARLIALFALDDQHQILPVQLMPPRQPCAVLLKSGQLGHSRLRTFAPWIVAAVARIGRAFASDDCCGDGTAKTPIRAFSSITHWALS